MMELNGQLFFLLFLAIVCIVFLAFLVNMVLNPQPDMEPWEMPEFALKPTTTSLKQTSTTKPTTITTLATTSTDAFGNTFSTTSTSSTATSTTFSDETETPFSESFTITSCDGHSINHLTGAIYCGETYFCDFSKIGRVYENIELMLYDACIPDDGLPVEIESYEGCDSRLDPRMRELCLINTATTLKDVGGCYLIDAQNYQDACFARVAFVKLDMDLCYKVFDRSIKLQCVRAVKINTLAGN